MSNLPTQFQQRDSILSLAPPWLQHDTGERFLYTIGLGMDVLLEKANQGQRARMPLVADPSALPYLAADRVLSQGPTESDVAFAVRLSQAFEAWSIAGNRRSILAQVQAYFSTPQPLYAAQLPECLIVGGNGSSTTWDTVYTTTPSGGAPAHAQIAPANWNWDGTVKPWRSWLVLFFALVPTGQSGNGAVTGTASAGSLLGRNVAGVWVPGVSGTPVNTPWLTITGLNGLTLANVQQWLTLGGSAHAANNAAFQIVQVLSAASCVIAAPNAVAGDGPLTWSIGSYPIVGPAPVFGAPGFNWGDGETTVPPVDTGSNVGGVWRPATRQSSYGVARSWGLNVPTATMAGVRQLLNQWKSRNTYYPHIIVAFDGQDSRAGAAFSPWSAQGTGNPDGTFGSPGKNVGGVWAPARLVSSTYDCYCDGTGLYSQCSVHNQT
jgi:hypothetical protein